MTMTDPAVATPEEVLDFWFSAGPDKWFSRDDAFDATVRARFLPTYDCAAGGHLSEWETTPADALALVIVLDQFPRNMFRDSDRVYAADALAREMAQLAIDEGFDLQTPLPRRNFFYLPFMHSESLADQERCVVLSRERADENTLKFAELHRDIIQRFGRFPHRNAALGRTTTAAEQAFLDKGGFAG